MRQLASYCLHKLPPLQALVDFDTKTQHLREMAHVSIDVLQFLIGLEGHSKLQIPFSSLQVAKIFGSRGMKGITVKEALLPPTQDQIEILVELD